MRSIPSRRLLSVAGTTALALSLLAALTLGSAQAAGGQQGRAPAVVSAAGSASGFLFYVYPDPQPTCSTAGTLGTNASADPSIDRDACAFARFTVTGATGPVKADLYAEGQDTPFESDLPASESSTTPGSYTVRLTPGDAWPAGRIQMVVKDGGGQLGGFAFALNDLRATLNTGAATHPGDPFTVSGTIAEHSARTTFAGGGVPATFALVVSAPDGTELFRKDVTAANNGSFSEQVPGESTDSLVENGALAVTAVDAGYDDASTGAWAAETAGTATHTIQVPATTLVLKNSFVSSVGWVKPGDTYPSRILVTNPTAAPITGASVSLTAPTGTSFTSAAGPGSHPVAAQGFTWTLPTLAAGETRVLVLESKAKTVGQLATIVWRDLSTTAVLHVAGEQDSTSTSHGPKVIPPDTNYDTARYGDRPFPVVPLQYSDRSYQSNHSGDSLESVINAPANDGSTFNLYQEMSLGQLFPEGTVPSKGIGNADFTGFDPAFPLTSLSDGAPNTCHGYTYADAGGAENPLYSTRISNGVYNLPGNTDYYGDDANGSALIGAESGQGSLQQIDSGCGPTGKIVADAVALADPEIDYSDYDTDKDGVVDFFMGVFAGCGGNGASQLGACADGQSNVAPYDNVWPHSSSLEYYYSDPATKLPGVVTNDQLKDLEGNPQFWTNNTFTKMTDDPSSGLKVYVRVGPYNLNPETAIDKASVISHEYGHSLGLPDFYSTGTRQTYGDWNLMATDKSQNMDAFSRQELGWVVPEVLSADRTVNGWTDSKHDTGTIHWQTEDGEDYVLENGADGIVHNSQMYVAKLPGRQLLDGSAFEQTETSEGASASHLWWSDSGNDFGCPPTGGHNFDLAVPEAANLPAGSTINLSFKSRWDIEWDFDYGFVMTTVDRGATYTSQPSEKGYTTPASTNPNANACLAQFGNGITGSSGSYQAGTEQTDRTGLTDSPPPVFLTDSYDVSDIAGTPDGAIRFSYATDPGLARPGWFIDDVKVTATLPGGATKDLYVTDFESSGSPSDPAVYNGGCREDLSTAQQCTQGWRYLEAGSESAQDHAYYLEMRDRSGFDYEGFGQIDRAGIGWTPGLYLAYTDESHGYGNTGTDDPPAQSPLDAVPDPGSEKPDLNDAAFTTDAGKSVFSDSGEGHTDNYTTPTTNDKGEPAGDGLWHFRYHCLGFEVTDMSGQDTIQLAGDLLGDVQFTMGQGCGTFDYGYAGAAATDDTPPTAGFTTTPKRPTNRTPLTLDGSSSTDDVSASGDLTYAWDFHDGGSDVDATGPVVTNRFKRAGVHPVTLTVTDEAGNSGQKTRRVRVNRFQPCNGRRVERGGGWRVVEDASAPGGSYCDNRGPSRAKDVMELAFSGPFLAIDYGRARHGGRAAVFIDGQRVRALDFRGDTRTVAFGPTWRVGHLGKGSHRARIVMLKKSGYVDAFVFRP